MDESFLQAENEFLIGTGLLHVQYGETISGFSGYLDKETGDINSTVIKWTKLYDVDSNDSHLDSPGFHFFPGAYFSGMLIYADGSTDYDGYTLSGSPISTTDLSTFLKGYLSFGKAYKVSERIILIPKLMAGIQNWKRVSNPNFISNGVNYESVEIYRHLNAGFGIKSDVRIWNREIISFGVDFLQNFNSNMTSSYTGNLYELGNFETVRVNGEIIMEVTKSVNFYGAIDYETFNYGKSDIASDGFLEPDSKTSLTLYSVGVAYAY